MDTAYSKCIANDSPVRFSAGDLILQSDGAPDIGRGPVSEPIQLVVVIVDILLDVVCKHTVNVPRAIIVKRASNQLPTCAKADQIQLRR
jgi:hypothetical protein